MKRFSICLALFAALLFVISCGGGSKKENSAETQDSDSGETVTDSDTADTETSDGDTTDTTPDNGDTVDTGTSDDDKTDSATDNGDTTDDSGDSQPDNGDTIDDYDEEDAKSPCDQNPCADVSASDGECTEKDETYECGCFENYSWKEGDCVADSQHTECKNLPENAVWNTATEITQKWTGSVWEPSTNGVYNEEVSTTECRFKCNDGYEWNGAKCVVIFQKCNAENADKTCKDDVTGYIWSAQSAEKYGQEDIKTYCEGLTTDNLSWRTPNIDELRTIIRNCDKTKTNGVCPVTVAHFDYNTYWNDDCKGCTPEEGIEYNIFGTKKGDSYFRLWSSTQSEENSISYYTVMFSSDTYMAYIGPDYTSSWNIRCLGSGKCQENYELDGNFECVPATRLAHCENLPENAVSNSIINGDYNIVQVWNPAIGKWLPENTTFKLCFDDDPSECCFHCEENNYRYNQAENKCEQKTRKLACRGLPDYAEWNGTDGITQTQSSNGTWLPNNNTGVYDTNPSETECHFKCQTDFEWNNGKRCLRKTPYLDSTTGLTWSALSSSKIGINEAVNYCSTYSEAGLSGWRLPTINELRTLIKNCKSTMPNGSCPVSEPNCLGEGCFETLSCDRCHWAQYNDDFDEIGRSIMGDDDKLLSSSSYDDYFAGVDFRLGNIEKIRKTDTNGKENSLYVRCVK